MKANYRDLEMELMMEKLQADKKEISIAKKRGNDQYGC